jgi:hypothetical protein
VLRLRLVSFDGYSDGKPVASVERRPAMQLHTIVEVLMLLAGLF